jgi:cytochrome d ubiquinol oxidase subunit II
VAYVPVAFILAGMAAYTVLAGADFGAGLWTLLTAGPLGGPTGHRVRDQARHAMGPVWEANHVWLIFVLVVCWTAYPVAFGSVTSTLAAPLLIAAIGIIFRGAAYALRGVADSSRAARWAENLFAVSSVLTPFALGTAVGAIAVGRVPVGNAAGNLVTSWLSPAPVLVGALAVVFSGYLAAVFLAADLVRYGENSLSAAFRRRAIVSGVLSGGLALAGLLVMRGSGLNLTHGAALALVCVSGVAGLATLMLCWRSLFGLARLTAALAVGAVVVGWAAAQAPRFLPGMTVTQAAAGRSTLVALVIAVACGSAILLPALVLLFSLLLRGRLDTPESHAPDEASAAPVTSKAPVAPAAPAAPVAGAVASAQGAGEGSIGAGDGTRSAAGSARGSAGASAAGSAGASARGSAAGSQQRTASEARGAAERWGGAAVAGLVAGAGLLVFTDASWTHVLGVAGLLLCAIAVFALTATPLDR